VKRLVAIALALGCSGEEPAAPADAAADVGIVLDTSTDGSKPIFESCADGVKNGSETDVDCGGSECSPCKVGRDCIRSEDCDGVCRETVCALPRACSELRRAGIKSGVHDLEIEGSTVPFYCDMATDDGGYTMVFKISAGVAGQPASLWTAGMPLNDTDKTLLTPNKSTKNYLSRIVTKLWNLGFDVSDVRVSAMIGGKEIKFFKFDARGSSVVNWFIPSRLIATSYSDLTATTPTNIFSIAGDPSSHREWFISRAYGGCDVDSGWLVADWAPDPCAWESANPAVRILFAPGNSATNWTSSPSRADALVVFVR
jgi:hypothetical protein